MDDCWTYTYWKPFIVYIEKTPGKNAEEIKRNQDTKQNALRQEWVWFETNIIKRFKLQLRLLLLRIQGASVVALLSLEAIATPKRSTWRSI